MAGRLPYRGRFAPSPTGPLHFGSLLAALASYLDARANGGEWLLRVEDIDPPREAPGSVAAILRSLDAHGLHWDGEVLFQSSRLPAYDEALNELQRAGLTFNCSCTRAVLGANGSCGERCTVNPGDPCATRLRLQRTPVTFTDAILGPQSLAPATADLVLQRRDGLFSYALAVVVDDGWQGITDVVRGMDLLEQTPVQLGLLEKLSYARPRYAHLPLLCDQSGCKLSKQTGALPLDDSRALDNLLLALQMLGQDTSNAETGTAEDLLRAATRNWNLAPLQRRLGEPLVYPAGARP